MFGFMTKRTKPLVIHIDDERDIRDLLLNVLERLDLDSLAAADGPSGIKLVESKKPDLVLCDLRMPGMDGFEVCRAIKKQPEFKAMPLLMLTAFSQLKDVERAMAEGADGYIIKPIDLPKFRLKLCEVLKLELPSFES